METSHIGDTVENSVQRAVIRWLGFVHEISIIGLQLISGSLPGYTDGICPLDDKRYFDCPNGQGYYVFESNFVSSYKTIQKYEETNQHTTSGDTISSIGKDSQVPSVIQSGSSPSASQAHRNPNNSSVISSSRGVLSRLVSEQEQRKLRQTSSSTDSKESCTELVPNDFNETPARTYCPENYRSKSFKDVDECQWYETPVFHDNENENNNHLYQATNSPSPPQLHTSASLFGQEYFLDGWTLGQVKSFMENQIPPDNRLCLNIFDDKSHVQTLVDDQVHACLPVLPSTLPKDVSIELIKIFDHVKQVFPSRAIRLYNNDYLLLAILCSNNQCAYVRTMSGWAYTDATDDHNELIVVDEISQLIHDANAYVCTYSEQCLHVLGNTSFLYYKLVE